MSFVVDIQPVNEYQYAYPMEVLEKIADLFLNGLKAINFKIITPDKINNIDSSSIVGLLNKAWKVFQDDPMEFVKWEEEIVTQLKQSLLN